jgi:hypothetical protein
MTLMEIAVSILIHAVVPISGLGLYLRLRERMIEAQITDAPIAPLFILFATYGGWLLVGLTFLLWYWSGMATLGLAYLIFIAPVVMLALAVRLYKQRNLSSFHFGAFAASAVYVPLLIGVWFVRSVTVEN